MNQKLFKTISLIILCIFMNLVIASETNPKMTIVLAAPSVDNPYYKKRFHQIIDFQINYAKKIMQHDQVRILINSKTRKYFEGKLPQDILISEDMYDIWMRDFSTVNPKSPVQFVYTSASMSASDSKITQARFNKFANKHKLPRKKTKLILDGGNIVDNYAGRAITTTRFLKDNGLSYSEGKQQLKKLLGAKEVAIIKPDDDVLAHADGMVAWIDDDVLLVNDYSKFDKTFHNQVIRELKKSFPGIKIIPIPTSFDDKGLDKTRGIQSACGININLVATYGTLYVPVFSKLYEAEVLKIIKNNTKKKIVTVDARQVCGFGGSVRCLSWQLDSKKFDLF